MRRPWKSLKRKHVFLIVALVLAAAGGGFAYSKRGPKPTEVEVATVGREDIQAKVTANGKVQAKKKVDISATIPGQITLLAVKEGDRVRKGQLLLQIDAVNPRAAARSNEFSMEALLQDQQLRPAPGRGQLRRPHHPRGRDPARPHYRQHRGGGGPGGGPPGAAGARHPRRRP
jgi:multidrug efflux pump subunit AcrA (membrane-fusion protein)